MVSGYAATAAGRAEQQLFVISSWSLARPMNGLIVVVPYGHRGSFESIFPLSFPWKRQDAGQESNWVRGEARWWTIKQGGYSDFDIIIVRWWWNAGDLMMVGLGEVICVVMLVLKRAICRGEFPPPPSSLLRQDRPIIWHYSWNG